MFIEIEVSRRQLLVLMWIAAIIAIRHIVFRLIRGSLRSRYIHGKTLDSFLHAILLRTVLHFDVRLLRFVSITEWLWRRRDSRVLGVSYICDHARLTVSTVTGHQWLNLCQIRIQYRGRSPNARTCSWVEM